VAESAWYGHRTITVRYYAGQTGVNVDGASGRTYAAERAERAERRRRIG
jgi:hypothetical protein